MCRLYFASVTVHTKNNQHMFSCFRYWLVKNPLALYDSV